MNPVRHAAIRTKVALAPSFAILCLVVVAGMGVWAISTSGQTLAQIDEQRMATLGVAADMERRIAALYENVNQSLVWEGAGLGADTVGALDKRIAKEFDELDRFLADQANNAAWSEADRATMKSIEQAFAKFRKSSMETIDIKSTGLATASNFISMSAARYKDLNLLIADLAKRQHAITRGEVVRVRALGDRSRLAMLIGLVLAVLMAALTTIWCARLITRPLQGAVTVLQAVAAGDFTHALTVESRDEVGQASEAINRAVDAMRTALHEVGVAAQEAASASQQVSSASAHMSTTAQSQASSLEETAASLEEITGTVKQNADNARQANQLAVGSRDVAVTGGEVVVSAVKAMDEINRASRKIADIITTIDEIAFQTNLLALNAAVEAARAGEQGRGFAVVAAEVRNLAQRAAVAAKEIKTLIQDSVTKVQAGSELVTKSGATLDEIVASVKRVTDIIAEIAAASGEQTTGIEQVNRAVAQMDQAVQANAAQTEELTSTAEALASQAAHMQALVSRFKVGSEPAGRSAYVTAPESLPMPVQLAPAAGHRRVRGLRATDRPFEPDASGVALVSRDTAGPPDGYTNGHANGANGQKESDGFEEF